MMLSDYYLEKCAMKGFAMKPMAYLGGVGAAYGGLKGALTAPKDESKATTALKRGLLTGITAGVAGGLTIGQAVKHGRSIIDKLEKSMKVI